MKSLLFATDATQNAHAAIPLVASLAKRTEAKVEVFHVPASGDRATGDAAAELESAVSKLRSAGAAVDLVQVAGGNAADGIREQAKKSGSSLIVVVGHSGDSVVERILGSTVYDLVDESPCDLLVVAHDHAARHKAVRRSLVPVNFSEEAIRSLQAAAELTEEGSEIVLLFNVPKEFPAFHGARGLGSDYKNSEQLEANWRRDLETFWNQYGSMAHTPVIVRSQGSWHEEAENAAETYDCDLVVAAETDGALRRGIAEKLAARLATCPVLVKRTSAAEPDDPQLV